MHLHFEDLIVGAQWSKLCSVLSCCCIYQLDLGWHLGWSATWLPRVCDDTACRLAMTWVCHQANYFQKKAENHICVVIF